MAFNSEFYEMFMKQLHYMNNDYQMLRIAMYDIKEADLINRIGDLEKKDSAS